MCANAFPGVQIVVSEAPGATRCEFWVWLFEVSFTLTTKAMTFVDRVGQVGFTFRFKHTPTSTPHAIRQDHVDGVVAVQGLLDWVVQYVQGIACAIEMAQTHPPEPPAFSF